MPALSSNRQNTLAALLSSAIDEQNRAQMQHQASTPYAPAIPARESLRTWAKGVGERSSPTGMLTALAGEAKRFTDMPIEEKLGQLLGHSGGSLSGLVGHTAWHGSPHLFDKFKKEAIGTGEGAQAYGHGLYFAEAPDVAKSYADDLTKMRVQAAQSQLQKHGGNVDDAINASRQEIKRLQSLNLTPETGAAKRNSLVAGQEEKLAELLAYKNQGAMNTGNMYKVDIPDEAIPRMLDWDKPLSEQSQEVQEALKPLQDDLSAAYSKTAGDVYNYAAKRYGKDVVSQKLQAAGIPGIKYLDGSSRAGGAGTSNYVMFNPDDIRILERNGQATGQVPWSKK